MRNCNLTFIDRDEIEEALSDYYDFESVTPSDWKSLDTLIKEECKKEGITSTDLSDEELEDYYRIADRCCDILGFPTFDD